MPKPKTRPKTAIRQKTALPQDAAPPRPETEDTMVTRNPAKAATTKKAQPKKLVAQRPKRGKNKVKGKAEKLSAVPNGPVLEAVVKIAKRVAKAGLPRKTPRRPARLPALERLEVAIAEVRLGARVSPRTRKLLASGVPKMAQKVIEEAGEVAIEALQGKTAELIEETVDLFYNTLVLLSASGVTLEALWAEMDRREVALGMAEKLPKPSDLDG